MRKIFGGIALIALVAALGLSAENRPVAKGPQ